MTAENQLLMDKEQEDNIKGILFNAFYGHFNSMCEQVKKLPISPHIMNHILFKFDDGMLWVKEQFHVMSFNKSVAPLVSDTPITLEENMPAA